MKKVFKNEGDVKQVVKEVLKNIGPDCWWFMPPANGYGRSGVPDFVGCVSGAMFCVETKFGAGKPTANQMREMTLAGMAGAVVWVVNEQNIGRWTAEFEEWAVRASNP
jgi:hypothetical protein